MPEPLLSRFSLGLAEFWLCPVIAKETPEFFDKLRLENYIQFALKISSPQTSSLATYFSSCTFMNNRTPFSFFSIRALTLSAKGGPSIHNMSREEHFMDNCSEPGICKVQLT